MPSLGPSPFFQYAMDIMYDDEIFELWLRAPDLADEMPWILRHSFEIFQETQLMEDEKMPGYAPAPFEPVQNPRTLQDLPLHLEELDSNSDTLSTPQDCLVDDHNSFVSTPSLGVKSARTLYPTSEVPLSSITSLPCNAYTETIIEGAKLYQDLPAEHEKSEPVHANSIMLRPDPCSDGPCVFISTPSLGITLEAARILSYAPSSSHQGTLCNDLNMVRWSSALGGEPEEAATESNAPASLCQDLPSEYLHTFMSTPSLGIKLGGTAKLSHTFMSLHQDSSDEPRMIRPTSSLEVKLEAVENIADARKQLIQYPSAHDLHLFLSTPSLGVRLGATKRIPGSLETSSEPGFLPVEECVMDHGTKDGTNGGDKSEIVAENSEQDSAGLLCEGSGVRNVNIPLLNTYITEDKSPAQEYKNDIEVSWANSKSIGFLPSRPEDTNLSTAHDVTEDAAVSPALFATQQAPEISLDDCKEKTTACDRREAPTTPETLLGPNDVRQENFNHPLQPSQTRSSQDKAVQVNRNDLDSGAHSSSSKGRAIFEVSSSALHTDLV